MYNTYSGLAVVEVVQGVKEKNHENSENVSGVIMIENNDVDWDKIKAEYLCGVGPKFLSEKYEIPVDTIRSRIKRGEWHKEKKETGDYVKLRVREQYSESLTEIQMLTREEYRRTYWCIREKMRQLISVTTDAKDLYILSKALNECMKQEFICLGVHDGTNENLWRVITPQPVIGNNEKIKKSNQEEDSMSMEKMIKILRSFI